MAQHFRPPYASWHFRGNAQIYPLSAYTYFMGRMVCITLVPPRPFGIHSGNVWGLDGWLFCRHGEKRYDAACRLGSCIGPSIAAGLGGFRLGGNGFGELCGGNVRSVLHLIRYLDGCGNFEFLDVQ